MLESAARRGKAARRKALAIRERGGGWQFRAPYVTRYELKPLLQRPKAEPFIQWRFDFAPFLNPHNNSATHT